MISFGVKKTNLQLVGQTDLLHSPDKPFGRIVLVPLDGIPVVHRELVVEIVIALSDCDKRGDHMVAGGVFVVKRSFAEPMSERVDTKGRLQMNQVSKMNALDMSEGIRDEQKQASRRRRRSNRPSSHPKVSQE